MLITFFPIHHTRAGRFPPIYRPALFLFMMGPRFRFLFLTALLPVIAGKAFSQPLDPPKVASLSERIDALRLKSHAHGKYVGELLDDSSLKSVATESSFLPVEPASPSAPDDQEFVFPVENVAPEVHPGNPGLEFETDEDAFDEPISEQSLESSEPEFIEQDASLSEEPSPSLPTYEEIYAPKYPQRRIGYYFGPFLAVAFPDNSAVRDGEGIHSYASDPGVLAGIRLGRDFGSVRWEGEYSYLSHDSFTADSSGKSTLHNFVNRIILEKEIGKRADLRTGMGLGFVFVDKELGDRRGDGTAFTYDFLAGWSFRIMENWSLNADYRYYLTSAHENFDRCQGHLLEISTMFDL